MPANLVSPDSGNYFIGRGYVTMKNITASEVAFSDLGNITMMELLPKPTMLDHYSSRVGVRKKDFVAVTQLEATLNMELEEYTARNMANALLGTAQESGSVSIEMFATPQIYAAFEFFGTNTIGPVWDYVFPYVLLTPQKAIQMISQGSGSWGSFTMQGDVLQDPTSGQFAIATSVSF